jgi:hypothetical protein
MASNKKKRRSSLTSMSAGPTIEPPPIAATTADSSSSVNGSGGGGDNNDNGGGNTGGTSVSVQQPAISEAEVRLLFGNAEELLNISESILFTLEDALETTKERDTGEREGVNKI